MNMRKFVCLYLNTGGGHKSSANVLKQVLERKYPDASVELLNGFDQKNSNYIIMRYMDSNFFINNDGTFDTEWQKQIYNRIRIFDHDLEYLLNK